MRKPALLSAEEIRALATSAITILNKRKSGWREESDEEKERRFLWIGAAVEAVRFCARAAEILEDTSLLPVLIEAVQAVTLYNKDYGTLDHIPTVAQALQELLSYAPSLSREAAALARHDNYEVRAAFAEGLRPVREKEIALLELLSSDPVAEVRSTAQKSLSSVREIPWWRGKFSQDPTACLSATEALALKPALEEISQLLDKPLERGQVERIVSRAGLLPDTLLFDLARTCLSRFEMLRSGALDPLGRLLLSRQGGDEILLGLFEDWATDEGGSLYGGATAARMMSALSPEARASLCRKFLDKICAAPPEERTETDSPLVIAAKAVAYGWPAKEDPSPLLDIILSLEESEGEETDLALMHLATALHRQDLNLSPITERLIEAFLSGCPGPWQSLSIWIQMLLDRLPKETLRPVAERALQSEEDELWAWGLLQLTGPLHDPAKDPAPPLILKGFFEKPRTHRLIYEHFHDLGARALPLLRAELRAKTLGFSQAARVMLAIDLVYGGLIDPIFDREEEEEKRLAERQREIVAFLGPEELRGPPTEEEWCQYRAIRDAHPLSLSRGKEEDRWSDAMRIFPKGPWHPEDQAFFLQAMDLFRAGEEDLGFLCATAIGANPTREHLPLLDEILAASPERHKLIRKQKRRALKKLGIPPEEAETKSEHSWTDEEEDE